MRKGDILGIIEVPGSFNSHAQVNEVNFAKKIKKCPYPSILQEVHQATYKN